MNDAGFQAIKGGVDLNGKMEFRANSGTVQKRRVLGTSRRAYANRKTAIN